MEAAVVMHQPPAQQQWMEELAGQQLDLQARRSLAAMCPILAGMVATKQVIQLDIKPLAEVA